MGELRVEVRLQTRDNGYMLQRHMCEALEAHAGESHTSSGVAWRLRGSSDEGYLLVREIEPIRGPEAMVALLEAELATLFLPCTPWGERLGVHLAGPMSPLGGYPREFWLARLQEPPSYWRTLVRLSGQDVVGESVYRDLPAVRAEREARALACVEGAAHARLGADSPMRRLSADLMRLILSELVWPEVYLSCE